MDILDPNEWPIGARNISILCDVDLRTAQRWLAGDSRPPAAAIKLIQLTQQNRIMPADWPSHFRFCNDGSLDTGHKIRLTRWMLEHHSYSIHCWNNLVANLKAIEARMDELELLLPRANVIELDQYRRRFAVMKKRPFALASGYEAPVDKNVVPFR